MQCIQLLTQASPQASQSGTETAKAACLTGGGREHGSHPRSEGSEGLQTTPSTQLDKHSAVLSLEEPEDTTDIVKLGSHLTQFHMRLQLHCPSAIEQNTSSAVTFCAVVPCKLLYTARFVQAPLYVAVTRRMS